MRRKIITAAIVFLSCLWLPRAAEAQIYGGVTTAYDPSTNRMVAYAETSATYGAGMFYCVHVVVYLRSTGGQETAGAQWNCDVGYAFATASLPYDPNVEYDADADHQGDPYFQDSYGQYMDYYNLQTYMQGEPVVYPGADCLNCAYNSCRGTPISPTGCTSDLGGEFTDQLRVGCPLVDGDCGTADFIAKWSWCPRGRSPVALASNTYRIGRYIITVNGLLTIPPGTHLYP